jgi:hypothetical protein
MSGTPVMARGVLSDAGGWLFFDTERIAMKSATLCCFYGYALRFPMEYTGEKPDDAPK